MQLYGRGTFRECAIGALKKEGMDMPSELMGRDALSLRFRVEGYPVFESTQGEFFLFEKHTHDSGNTCPT